MVRILIASPGCGKTYAIKNEIVHKNNRNSIQSREIYVIERQDNCEYSNIFNTKYVHVLKLNSDISFLEEKKSCDIYIDCECYDDDFLQAVYKIIKRARINDNVVTITFSRIEDNLAGYKREIFANANEVLIGKCDISSECKAEELFQKKLELLKSGFAFRKVW